MAPRPTPLRLLTSAARALLAFSLAAWCLSIFQLGWESPRAGVTIYLAQGAITHVSATFDTPGLHSRGPAWPTQWWWSSESYLLFPPSTRLTYTKLPLWMPAAAAGAALLLARRLHLRRLRRAGLCTACAYDLTGITGPCPECGSAQ